jgi:hypothetical protein
LTTTFANSLAEPCCGDENAGLERSFKARVQRALNRSVFLAARMAKPGRLGAARAFAVNESAESTPTTAWATAGDQGDRLLGRIDRMSFCLNLAC